jgi:hypothetical protein
VTNRFRTWLTANPFSDKSSPYPLLGNRRDQKNDIFGSVIKLSIVRGRTGINWPSNRLAVVIRTHPLLCGDIVPTVNRGSSDRNTRRSWNPENVPFGEQLKWEMETFGEALLCPVKTRWKGFKYPRSGWQYKNEIDNWQFFLDLNYFKNKTLITQQNAYHWKMVLTLWGRENQTNFHYL